MGSVNFLDWSKFAAVGIWLVSDRGDFPFLVFQVACLVTGKVEESERKVGF